MTEYFTMRDLSAIFLEVISLHDDDNYEKLMNEAITKHKAAFFPSTQK